jgi:hypothetical protein
MTHDGFYANTSRRRGSDLDNDNDEPISPVSPIDEENDAPDNRHDRRISFVSALSTLLGQDELDDFVSPIGLVDVPGAERGRVSPVSPMSVSPLDSRRGSFAR